MRVVASIATIPPRLSNGDLQRCVDGLLHQTQGVDTIYVSIPYRYVRFPTQVHDADLPGWLHEPRYRDKVVVLRPPSDPGPIAKYMCVAQCMFQVPVRADLQDTVIFVGDDDQVYHPTLIERMVAAYPHDRQAVVQNRYDIVRFGSGGIVHGFVGLLVGATCLQNLLRFPLPPIPWVDDQVMSIYFAKEGVPMLASGVTHFKDIYAELQEGHEKGVGSGEALHMLGNRATMVREVCMFYGCRFETGGGVVFAKK